jgi:quercetin dioxygenase-like cupin family protein
MKRRFLVITLFYCASLPAQAPEPVPLAHGNTPGEPHHHLRIENEYVRVYYVEVPPHENTQLHQHDHDYLFVTLGDSDVINAVRDKPEVHLVLKDGETHFTRGGFAHVARNLADTPFRNVTIELLKPQGVPHNRCAKIIDGPLGNCPNAGETRNAIALRTMNVPVPMLETDELLVEAHLVKPDGTAWTKAGPEPARLLVSLNNVKLKVGSSDQMWKDMHPGDDIWIYPGAQLSVTNLSEDTDARFLILTFKDGATTKKP